MRRKGTPSVLLNSDESLRGRRLFFGFCRMGVAAEGNFLKKAVSMNRSGRTGAGQHGRGARFASSSLECIYYYVYI